MRAFKRLVRSDSHPMRARPRTVASLILLVARASLRILVRTPLAPQACLTRPARDGRAKVSETRLSNVSISVLIWDGRAAFSVLFKRLIALRRQSSHRHGIALARDRRFICDTRKSGRELIAKRVSKRRAAAAWRAQTALPRRPCPTAHRLALADRASMPT